MRNIFTGFVSFGLVSSRPSCLHNNFSLAATEDNKAEKEDSIHGSQGHMMQQSQPTKTATNGGGVKHQPYGIDVVLGSQWGDEGKGKLVDILSQVSF